MLKAMFMLMAVTLILAGCVSSGSGSTVISGSDSETISDALAFKLEHEELNGVPNPNNPELIFKDMYIPENNPFRYAELYEIVQLLENNGTGVVYLGFPICPWCRSFVPVLTNTAIEYGVREILYRNILEDRNILELEDGVIYETRAGHPEYYRLLELLGDLAPAYTGLEDDSFRRVFVPALLFIKDGEVIRYQGALASFQERVSTEELGGWLQKNEEEIEELSQIFSDYFEKLFENTDDCVIAC